ncbi:cell division cycle 7-related protein kinase [Platysternon megacephalum]|uniref:Cell division cycle 7-related protein kinase n=1 Tax=Platysternon megacephalum TaxID=55544 RepID=A0A4D9E7R4_9SAUR|nr:cell division cycle 7-related protein kinase [Platysternon megacephalum]
MVLWCKLAVLLPKLSYEERGFLSPELSIWDPSWECCTVLSVSDIIQRNSAKYTLGSVPHDQLAQPFLGTRMAFQSGPKNKTKTTYTGDCIDLKEETLSQMLWNSFYLYNYEKQGMLICIKVPIKSCQLTKMLLSSEFWKKTKLMLHQLLLCRPEIEVSPPISFGDNHLPPTVHLMKPKITMACASAQL